MEEKNKQEKVDTSGKEGSVAKSDKSEEKEQVPTEQILAVMKEIGVLQRNQELILQALTEKQGNRLVADKVKETTNHLAEQANHYGKKAKMYVQQLKENYQLDKEEQENILKEYETVLAEIKKEYEKKGKAILQVRHERQDQEQATYLKEHELKQKRKEIKKSPQYAEYMKQEEMLVKEIKKALAEGNLDLVTQKSQELKRLRSENPLMKCNQEIKRVHEQRKELKQAIKQTLTEWFNCMDQESNAIQETTKDRDNKLATRKKLNIFQKMAGAVVNKIGGGVKRFKDNVIKKVAEKVSFIRNKKVPEIKQKVGDETQQFQENMQQQGEAILGKNPITKEQLIQRAEARVSKREEADRQGVVEPKATREDVALGIG